MLDINYLRSEFARYLTTNTDTRWGLDAALLHVCKLAYEAGLKAEPEKEEPEVIRDETQDFSDF